MYLGSTQTLTPTEEVCIDCNNVQTISLKTEFTKCFDLGSDLGQTTFSWEGDFICRSDYRRYGNI